MPILLSIIFGLLFFALALLAVERARKKKAARLAELLPHDAPAAGVNGNGTRTPMQQRGRRRRARMNAAKRTGPSNANARSL